MLAIRQRVYIGGLVFRADAASVAAGVLFEAADFAAPGGKLPRRYRQLFCFISRKMTVCVVCWQLKMTRRSETLEARLLDRLTRKRRAVFLRADFDDLGGYDQVGRALGGLVRDGRLIKLGYGLYARARPSMLDGKPTPVKSMREITAEALRRLGVKTAPTRLEQDYNAGRTTQVPTGRVIAVRGRVRRKLTYNGVPLSFERAEPAAR